MLVELDGASPSKRVYDACVQTDYDTYVVTDSLEIAEIVPVLFNRRSKQWH